jgi:hypothetical protein
VRQGGTYEEWGVQKTVKEGGRADYASKTFVKAHFGRPDKDNKKRQLALNGPGPPGPTFLFKRL